MAAGATHVSAKFVSNMTLTGLASLWASDTIKVAFITSTTTPLVADSDPRWGAGDNRLMDVSFFVSFDNGVTFVSNGGWSLGGSPMFDKTGTQVDIAHGSWDWTSAVPTHIKVTLNVYVAITATFNIVTV